MLDVDFLPPTPDRRRRQLHRPRVRADLPPLRQPGHGRRDGTAADRAARTRRRPPRSPTSCEEEGIAFHLNAQCLAVDSAADGVAVHVSCERASRGDRRHAPADRRRPPPQHATTSASTRRASRPTRAAISPVDDQLRTSVPGIWALGDVNGRGAFTHTVLQRLRDRRRQPARQRSASRQRPHRRLRPVHRSAARPRRA